MRNIIPQLFLLILGGIVFIPLFLVGVLYTLFKHIYKLDYSIDKQFLPILRGVTLILDCLANVGAGELLNDVCKIKGKIRYGAWWQTISATTGLIFVFDKDTKFREFLDKILGKNHCIDAIREAELQYYKNDKLKHIDMGKINSYEEDEHLNGDEKLIGTDPEDSSKTKNYPLSVLKTYFSAGVEAPEPSEAPYKVYTALVSQSGSGAPTAIVKQNNTGRTFDYSYNTVGQYTVTMSGSALNVEDVVNFVSSNSLITRFANVEFLGGNAFSLTSAQQNTLVNMEIQLKNDVLLNTSVEIRIYE